MKYIEWWIQKIYNENETYSPSESEINTLIKRLKEFEFFYKSKNKLILKNELGQIIKIALNKKGIELCNNEIKICRNEIIQTNFYDNHAEIYLYGNGWLIVDYIDGDFEQNQDNLEVANELLDEITKNNIFIKDRKKCLSNIKIDKFGNLKIIDFGEFIIDGG
jgi:hypothetical protein